ncbi:MAG TPA: hypothetical protein VMV26_16320 [Alphaproteobacteria bacterium]|nr:hypothetical protein [Alphaproteobacteria bacterium]
MRNCVTAMRVAVVVALFALPPLLLPDNAAAADRRYGTSRRQDTQRTPKTPYVSPSPQPTARGWGILGCGLDRPSHPNEYDDCMKNARKYK